MSKHEIGVQYVQSRLFPTPGEIDRNSPIPLYHQLKEILRALIENRQWKAGDLLPNENQIASDYGLSRGTVREAMEDLVQEGLLNRQRGRGTFVATPKYEQDLLHLFSVHEYTKKTGHQPGSDMIEFTVDKAGVKIGEYLGVAEDTKVYKIVRIRTIDGEPIMYDQIYLTAGDFPGLRDKDLNTRSLYEILTNDYGTALGKARQTFEPTLIDVRESKLLKVDKGTAAMLIERITYRLSGAPVVYSKIIIRGDRCRFSAEISV